MKYLEYLLILIIVSFLTLLVFKHKFLVQGYKNILYKTMPACDKSDASYVGIKYGSSPSGVLKSELVCEYKVSGHRFPVGTVVNYADMCTGTIASQLPTSGQKMAPSYMVHFDKCQDKSNFSFQVVQTNLRTSPIPKQGK